MPYFEKTIRAGDVIEKTKSFSSRLGKKGIPRGTNTNKTPEEVEAVNEKKAEDKLRWLLYSNFKKYDRHIQLTYRKELRPEKQDLRKVFNNFLRRVRNSFKKMGKEFKYIAVTEYVNGNPHHHLIVEKDALEAIEQLWKYGAVRSVSITGYEHLANLAHYLIKETRKTFRSEKGPYRKRWNASSNLKKWSETVREIRATNWTEKPKATRRINGKDYYLDKTVGDGAGVENYECVFTMLPCQFYRLYPVDKPKKKAKIPIAWESEK